MFNFFWNFIIKITDWFNASGGTDTEYPTKFYEDEIKKMGNNVEELFNKATKEIIRDQEECDGRGIYLAV